MASKLYELKNNKDSSSTKSEVVNLRLTEQLKRSLFERAEEVGVTPSDYLRALLALPIQFDVDGARGPWKEVKTSPDEAVPSVTSDFDGHPTDVGSIASSAAAALVQRSDDERETDPIRVHVMNLITDKNTSDLTLAIDRWGVNYNQSVHALNALANRFDDESEYLHKDQIDYLSSSFNSVVMSNDELQKRLMELAEYVKEIVHMPYTHLESLSETKRFRSRRASKDGTESDEEDSANASVGEREDTDSDTEADA